jgi:NADH-quinone oxidoreductase subunit G
VRAEWQILAELENRIVAARGGVGDSPPMRWSDPHSSTSMPLTAAMATAQLIEAVPFYAGLTLEEIGGRGVPWQERAAAEAAPASPAGPFDTGTPTAAPTPNGALRLGTYRSIWAAPEVEISPALKFLAARQQAELSPADAERLGLEHGDRVEIGVAAGHGAGGATGTDAGAPAAIATGTDAGAPAANAASPSGATHAASPARIIATVALRGNVPAGTVFLGEATASQSATALLGDTPRLVTITLAEGPDATPAGDRTEVPA